MKTCFIILILAPFTFSQWDVGASYKMKSDIPENGFGLNISRNIPYQGATFGIKARAEINLFRQTAAINNSIEEKFLSEDYSIHIIGEYYFKNFSPYFGPGLGYSQTGIEKLSSRSLIFSILIGAGFPMGFFIPYLEVQGVNYFSAFERSLKQEDISSFQLRGSIGVSISINTLRAP